MARTVTIKLTVGDVRPAGWCEACSKPALIECDIYTLHEDGPHRLSTYRQCADCGNS